MYAMIRIIICCCLLCGIMTATKAQLCTIPGQTPVSAIFVCSGETFRMTTPGFCGQTTIPSPCNDGGQYTNVNPLFYRFNCYTAGTLGFTIVPDDGLADYSWQLWDVTNTNPVDVFTNPNLFLACNWSSNPGETGATSDGLYSMVCSGNQPVFSEMPALQAGHTYLLMICNVSNSTSGYQLTFTGGTATITDAIDPHMLSAELSCDRMSVFVRLNKSVKCNTLAPDGSDFSVSGGVTVSGATPVDCSTQFGTPAVRVRLSQPLGFGTYTLTIQNGNDGNSLIDICNRSIPANETLDFVSAPQQFTPMEFIRSSACKAGFVELDFAKPILCSSIAADGSDFIISGPQTVPVVPVLPGCASGATSTLTIRLNLPTGLPAGNYTIRLASGSDGNTILNDCLVPTPAGSTLSFRLSESVSAGFSQSNGVACSQKTIAFSHDGNNNVNTWNWNFGNGNSSAVKDPVVTFVNGQYNVSLVVSNGTCSDTAYQTVRISDEFNAGFTAPSYLCPGDELPLQNTSTGNISSWQWSFGNGDTSSAENPSGIRYSNTGRESWYRVRLIAVNSALGCADTATKIVRVIPNCRIGVPTAFTPNGDGKNDFLYPLNAVKANDLEFSVFNRYGQRVFFTRDWTRKWDGRINGAPQATGLYAWILHYTDPDTGERIRRKGTTLLMR